MLNSSTDDARRDHRGRFVSSREFYYYDRHGGRRYREPDAVHPVDDPRLRGKAPVRLVNALLRNNLTLDEAVALTDDQLLEWPGVGKESVRMLRRLSGRGC